jgi:hypothetical protein
MNNIMEAVGEERTMARKKKKKLTLYETEERIEDAEREAKRAARCPHCHRQLSLDVIASLWGAYAQSHRRTLGGGGRKPLPPSARCPCGIMSKERARLRNHICRAAAA